MKSPRQKTRHRHSPLKTSQVHTKHYRHTTPPSKPYLSRLAAAVEARETMPLSPTDPRYPRDLRRTALLRSVAQRLEVQITPLSFLCSELALLITGEHALILFGAGYVPITIMAKDLHRSLPEPWVHEKCLLREAQAAERDCMQTEKCPLQTPIEEGRTVSEFCDGASELNLKGRRPSIDWRLSDALQDGANLGAAFSSLGFSSPGIDRKRIPRPCFSGKELPKSSQPFPPA